MPKSKTYHHIRIIAWLLFAIAALMMVMTIVIPVGPKSIPLVIYSRNFSAIVCFVLLGLFLLKYYKIHKIVYKSANDMKTLNTIALLVAIAAIFKTLISIVFAWQCFLEGNVISAFYLGDAIAWVAVSVFMLKYRSCRKQK